MNFKKIGLGLVLFGVVLGMGATLSVRATNEIITNGGFESMFNGWDYSGPAVDFNGFSHSGTRYAVLGGLDDCVDNLSQTVTIPASIDTATLSYWYNITSEEPNTTNAQYDKLKVTIRDLNNNVLDIVDSRSNLNKDSCAVSSCYHKVTYDMKKYSGQTVKVNFYAETDSSKSTYFRIDDVSLIYVQNQLPDLTVDAIQVTPNPPTASGYSDWTVTVRNQSNQNINSPFDLSVYFDNNYVGKAGFSSLGANSTTASTWGKMTWPADTLSHNIKAIVDSSGAVNETNESNNTRIESFAATQIPIGIGILYIETTPKEANVYVDILKHF